MTPQSETQVRRAEPLCTSRRGPGVSVCGVVANAILQIAESRGSARVSLKYLPDVLALACRRAITFKLESHIIICRLTS